MHVVTAMIALVTSPQATLVSSSRSQTLALRSYRAVAALATWSTRHSRDAVRVTGAVRLLGRPLPNPLSSRLHLPQTHPIEAISMGQLMQPSIRRKTRTAHPAAHQTPTIDAIPASSQKGRGILARLWARFKHVKAGKRSCQCLQALICVLHSLFRS